MDLFRAKIFEPGIVEFEYAGAFSQKRFSRSFALKLGDEAVLTTAFLPLIGIPLPSDLSVILCCQKKQAMKSQLQEVGRPGETPRGQWNGRALIGTAVGRRTGAAAYRPTRTPPRSPTVAHFIAVRL